MSKFIATNVRFNKKMNRIELKGGSTNLVPRINEWSHYEDPKYLLMDLISEGVDISQCRTKFAENCKVALEKIKLAHRNIFGGRQDQYPYSQKSINPYSLYQISNYVETADKELDLSRITESYHEQVTHEYNTKQAVKSEAIEFYKKAVTAFYTMISVNPNLVPIPNPTNQ